MRTGLQEVPSVFRKQVELPPLHGVSKGMGDLSSSALCPLASRSTKTVASIPNNVTNFSSCPMSPQNQAAEYTIELQRSSPSMPLEKSSGVEWFNGICIIDVLGAAAYTAAYTAASVIYKVSSFPVPVPDRQPASQPY